MTATERWVDEQAREYTKLAVEIWRLHFLNIDDRNEGVSYEQQLVVDKARSLAKSLAAAGFDVEPLAHAARSIGQQAATESTNNNTKEE